ncbi:MAG: GatB/YqeY domain-containing protein [Desulfobacteraceae bacterium]|jgi:hypothetical protein
MTLNEQIASDLKEAMKARDKVRTDCLRMLKTAVKNAEIDKSRELDDGEIRSIIASLIKKGKEAALDFRNGHREDLAAHEEAEVRIYYEYLPAQLLSEEIEEILKEVISECGAQGPKDIGRVMKTAMARMAGRVQGKEVNEIAKKLLGS